jgi:hypothetical protein
MKKFRLTHRFLSGISKEYTEDTCPDWLTSKNSRKGSTMDMRWFWERHVLTLEIGQTVETDFQTILRIE